jgi:hypothetical protein
MKKNKMFVMGMSAMLLAFELVLAGCDNGSGPDSDPTTRFNAVNAGQWNAALAEIAVGGNNRDYEINVTANFSLDGLAGDNYTFPQTLSGITVTIRGGGKIIGLSSQGRLIRVVPGAGNSQKLVLRDITLKGMKIGVDGAVTNNNAQLVYRLVDNLHNCVWLMPLESQT